MGKNVSQSVEARNAIDKCLILAGKVAEAKRAHDVALAEYQAACKDTFGYQDGQQISLPQLAALMHSIAFGEK